jgi:hypothetical protein
MENITFDGRTRSTISVKISQIGTSSFLDLFVEIVILLQDVILV